MTYYRTIIYRLASSILFLLAFSFQQGFAQRGDTPEACAGSSCSCGGSILAGSCSSGWCCKPNIASCQCNFFSSKCSCGPAGASSLVIPTIYEDNILALSQYFKSNVFASSQSKTLAAKLPGLITAVRNQDVELYYGTSDELEAIARQLPASEKQLANNWVAARGGTVFLE